MPLPTPKADEKESDFIARCMSSEVAKNDFKDGKQRLAVCYAQYKKKPKSMSETTVSPNMELVRLVRERASGGLLCLASDYVNRAAEELGGGKAFRLEKKRAAKRLVFGGAVVEKKLSDVKELNKLLPAEAREAGVAFPEKTLLGFRNVITTPAEDRERDVLRTGGAIVTRRMGLLWQHLHTQPLGKMISVVEHTPKVLRVWSAILDMNQQTHDAAILVEADAMGISHGFRALDWCDRKGPDGKDPKQAGQYGFDITSFEIMEESLVSVPANVEAEIELWSRGKLESDEFKRHAEALRAKMPLSIPVNIDLRLNGRSLNGQKLNGHVNGRRFDLSGEKRAISTTKGMNGFQIDGSWEAIQDDLCEGAWQALSDASAPQIESRSCWLVATFDGEAIVCAQMMYGYGYNAPGQPTKYEDELYYRIPWSLNGDGEAEFGGTPELVDISVTVKEFALARRDKSRDKPQDKQPPFRERMTTLLAESSDEELRKAKAMLEAVAN